MLTNFLSSRVNLALILIIGLALLIIAWCSYNISIYQQALMALIICIMCSIVYTIGIARGMFLATLYKKNIENIVDAITKGDTIDDDDIQEIIRKETEKDNE